MHVKAKAKARDKEVKGSGETACWVMGRGCLLCNGWGVEGFPVTTYTIVRVLYAIHALTRPLLACTHPRVAPEFANDLPRRHIPQHHRLVPAAGAETAVVKGAGRHRREGRSVLTSDPDLGPRPRARPGPQLTRPRPAPRIRGRCTSAAACPAAGSTASGSYRCRTSDSNCHPLGNTREGL